MEDLKLITRNIKESWEANRLGTIGDAVGAVLIAVGSYVLIYIVSLF